MDLDVQGEWWLPGQENNKLYGVLKVTNGEAGRLELNGAFRSALDAIVWSEDDDSASKSGVISVSSLRDAGTYPIILGESGIEGKYYTLKDCWSSSSGRRGQSSKRSESVGVNQVIEGILFDGPNEQIEFDGCRITMRHLSVWLGRSGLKVVYCGTPEQFARVEAVGLEDLSLELQDTSKLHFKQTLATSGDRIHSAAIEQSCVLVWDFGSLRTPEEVTRAVGDVQDLVSIACNRPAEFESVVMVHPQAPLTALDGTDLPGRQPIEYYGQWLVRDRKHSPLDRHDLLFTFDDIAEWQVLRTGFEWLKIIRQRLLVS